MRRSARGNGSPELPPALLATWPQLNDILVVFLLLQRHFIAGTTLGSSKGQSSRIEL
ncbi:hypothetical protein [Streptomyces sp900116325]|uniref:hypothetical protein n=1 Tax=Streptomyces sp. 900116325 TaxID=3154295 RepID=UPI00331D9C03